MTKEEKARRNQIKHALKNEERMRFQKTLPANPSDIRDLFEFLDHEQTCDNQLTRTLQFLEQRKLPKDAFMAWLNENGRFCDCEVLFNVEEAWEEMMEEQWHRTI